MRLSSLVSTGNGSIATLTLIAFFILASLLAGCGKEGSQSPETAEQALAAAQSSVERANESIAAMQQESQQLQTKIEQQRTALDALIEKRLALLRQQLDGYRKSLYRLPASKENELKSTVADLQARLDALAGKFQDYRSAPREKANEALEQLESALQEFESAFQKIDAEIQQG